MQNESTLSTQAEQFFEILIQNSSDIILIVGTDGRIRYVNSAMANVLGYPPEDMVGRRVFEFTHPDDMAGARQTFEKAKNNSGTITGFGGRYRHANGSWVDLETKVTNLLNQPNIQGMLVNARDVTDRKKAEEALRLSEMRYHSMIEQAPDAIIIADSHYNITEVNANICALLGYSQEEFLNQNFLELFTSKEKTQASQLLQTLDESGKVTSEFLLRGKNNSLVAVDINIAKVGANTIQAIIRNISDRKKNELELHHRAQEFSALVENAHDVIARLDRNLRYIYINSAIEKATGFKPPEVVGTSLSDWALPNINIGRVLETARKVLDTGQAAVYDFSYQTPNGEHWYEVQLAPEFAPDGTVSSMLSISHDVTALKKAEMALRESEKGFRLLFANNPLPMWVYDCETFRFLEVNSTTLEEYGYSREEFLNMTLLDIRLPQDSAALISAAKQRNGSTTKAGYAKHLLKNGNLIDVEVTSHQIEFNGRRARLVVSRNITSRKQVENALAAERELLAVTLRSIGEGVLAVDTTGRIMLVNRQAEIILACKQAEVIGSPLAKVFQLAGGSEQIAKLVVTPENVGSHGSYENQTLTALDGTKHQVSLTCAPIYDHSSTIIGTVIAFQDVAEKQKLAEARIQASKLESLGLLAGGIAHDFNNLLTAAMTNLSLLRLPHLKPDELETFLGDTEKALMRSRDLTQQLLTFAKGGAPVKKTARLPEIIKESVSFTLHGSNVQAMLLLPDDLWPAEVDRGQLSQVIQNIVINAVQAMPNGGTIRIKGNNLTVDAGGALPLASGNYVKISVHDEGSGIASENLPKIFDPYFTTKTHGTGLGLATSYSIIKRHDGYISIQSELGKGTVVEFYLPTSTKTMSKETESSTKVALNSGRGRLLIMDDEVSIRNATSKLLGRMGYEVVVANDGNAALEQYKAALLEARPFAAVVMDLTIPGGMGGKEAIKHLLEIDPQAKAIVSSGYSNDSVIANYQEYGFKGILVKPFRLEDLTKVIEQVITQTEPVAQEH